MYPFIRAAYHIFHGKSRPAIAHNEVHVSNHICWPTEIDGFMEMNNGRILTAYDHGRFGHIFRTGLTDTLRENKWGMAVAGSTIRYRRRLRMFNRYEMRTQTVGRDAKFFYIQQSMWYKGACTSSVVIRMAVTDKNGIVHTDRLANATSDMDWPMGLPDWVAKWSALEDDRPWPPTP